MHQFRSLVTRYNKPLEWTGLHHRIALPPSAPCLPLRGSVQVLEHLIILDSLGRFSPFRSPTTQKAPAIARAKGVRSREGSPLRKPQLPEGRPQGQERLAVGLFIDLLGLELGLQLLHQGITATVLPHLPFDSYKPRTTC